MDDLWLQLPHQANYARKGASDPSGFKIMQRDIRRQVLEEWPYRVDQRQMGLEAGAVQVLEERHRHSLRSAAAEGRQEKQNSLAGSLRHFHEFRS
jgi:hypothetical protein